MKVNLPDEIYKALEKITENTEKIMTSTLEAGGKVVLGITKTNLSRAVTNSSGRSTGELVNSLGLSKVIRYPSGIYNIKVGFSEPRRHQNKGSKYEQTNAMIANILEYGKRDQPPRPFIRPTKIAAKKAATEAMISTFDAELSRLGVK